MPIEKDDRIDVKEYVENEESLKQKVKLLSEKVKSANHVVVFTGAGISTSAKIPGTSSFSSLLFFLHIDQIFVDRKEYGLLEKREKCQRWMLL